MADNDYQLKMIALAHKKGIDPSKMSPAQRTMISIQIRAFTELKRDSLRAAKSFLATSLHLRNVPLNQSKKNEEQCRKNECNRFREIGENKIPACDACSCQGRGLRAKWRDRIEECPKINPKTKTPYWSNVLFTIEQQPHILDEVLKNKDGSSN